MKTTMVEMSEHQRAYYRFLLLPSARLFSWSSNVAIFDDPADVAIFKAEFPDWEVW